MKKKLLFPCLLLTAVLLLSSVLMFGTSASELTMTQVSGGTAPTAGDTVTIQDENELKAFSKYVSEGGATAGITFRLLGNIELTTTSNAVLTTLNPIGGVFNGVSEVKPFQGVFDGGNFTISNLKFGRSYKLPGATAISNNANATGIGLFAAIDGGTVKNLTVVVEKVSAITGGDAFGVITPTANNATFFNCTVNAKTEGAETVTLTGNKFTAVAGMVGSATNSTFNECTVNLNIKGYKNVAGVVGTAENTAIRNCLVFGTYADNGGVSGNVLGGVAAQIAGNSVVENCYSSAKVASTSSGAVLGGVVGSVGTGSTVENCFSDAAVDAKTGFISGSLVGKNGGAVKHSFGLREDSKRIIDKHADIGESLAGATKESIYAYKKVSNGTSVSFVVGTITPATENIACSKAIHSNSLCEAGAPDSGCSVCGGDGVIENATTYRFVEDTAIASLVDALNAWTVQNGGDGVEYLNWVVTSQNTITNCKHSEKESVVYEDPTCSEVGHAKLVCKFCGMIVEEAVEVPIDPDAHASANPDHYDSHGEIFGCITYECCHCHETIDATGSHTGIDESKPCQDQKCTTCGVTVEHTTHHTKPDNFDSSKPCKEYTCSVCGGEAQEGEHTPGTVKANCQSLKCTVCETVLQAASASHSAGLAPTCTTGQLCLKCGDTLNAPRGHEWGAAATCGSAQKCKICNKDNPDEPARENEHVGDKSAPTCTEPVKCAKCDKILKKKLGHTPDDTAVDCGHGNCCSVCHAVLESATADHVIDWSKAVIVRAATPTRTGIVVGTCDFCEREVEGYTTYSLMSADGKASLSGASVIVYVGSSVKVTFGKVSDHAAVAIADGYLPLQVLTLSTLNQLGEAANFGNVTFKIVLNKSAAKMSLETMKLYQVANGQATEVAITSVADGYITFTAGAGTFLLAGEKTAAFAAIGTVPVNAQQTAALVGTHLYERKDDEV